MGKQTYPQTDEYKQRRKINSSKNQEKFGK